MHTSKYSATRSIGAPSCLAHLSFFNFYVCSTTVLFLQICQPCGEISSFIIKLAANIFLKKGVELWALNSNWFALLQLKKGEDPGVPLTSACSTCQREKV